MMGLAGGLGALQGGSSIIGGIQGQNLANQQAGLLQQQAAVTRQAGGQEAAAGEARNLAAIHAGIASAAAGGIAPTAGSAGTVMRANLAKTTLQSTFTRYGANLAAGQDIAEAAISRFQGRQQMVGGIAGAGTSALTAAFNAYGIKSGLPGSSLIY